MSYQFRERSEVLNLVPDAARVVVDVGCGEGHLGASLKRRRPATWVAGLEPAASYAEKARAQLDDVHVGTAENGLPAHWPRPDCLVFADSLEHMADPWTVLERLAADLASGGCVVISLPNVAHHSVLTQLGRGRFDYAEEGQLDRTHLRFFTRHSALELVERAGLRVDRLERVLGFPGGFPGEWMAQLSALPSRLRERSSGPPRAGSSRLDRYTFQYLIRAYPRRER